MRRLVWLCAVVLGGLEFAAGLRDYGSWLDPAAGGSLFRYIGAVAVLIAASGAAGLAWHGRSLSRLLLAAGLCYVAIDYLLGLHQSLAADLDTRALGSLDWPAGLLVANTALLAVVGLLLVLEIRVAPRRSTLLVAGTALLVAALGARFVGGTLAAGDRLPAGEPLAAGEAAMHACAMSAWLLVAAGMLSLARDSTKTVALGGPPLEPPKGERRAEVRARSMTTLPADSRAKK